ncbi:MAG TPA: hypothetical protein VFU94_02495 [Conexibacter sp.]|nr:hypothetical protein [Conexibacter sp.]
MREDIHLAASVVTLVLGIVALITWIASWPSAVIPTLLFVVGLFGLTIFVYASVLLTLESSGATSGAVPPPVWFELGAVIVGVTLGWIAMRPLHHPTMVRVVGGIVLGLALVTSSVVALTALRARYRHSRSSEPVSDAGAGQLAFGLDTDHEIEED